MAKYYLISDLDHTLLNEQGRLSQNTIQALKHVQWPLMLASARLPIQMRAIIDRLHLTGPQAGLNGAVIFQLQGADLRILQQWPIALTTARYLQRVILRHFPQLNFTWMDAAKWYVSRFDQTVQTEIDYTNIAPVYNAELSANAQPLQILLVISDPKRYRQVKEYLTNLRLPDITIHDAGDGYLTINARGVDKGNAVQYLLDHRLAMKDELIAVGDDENDLPMLKKVHYAVAMGNATPEVQRIADWITASNENDGIVQIIERIAPKRA